MTYDDALLFYSSQICKYTFNRFLSFACLCFILFKSWRQSALKSSATESSDDYWDMRETPSDTKETRHPLIVYDLRTRSVICLLCSVKQLLLLIMSTTASWYHARCVIISKMFCNYCMKCFFLSFKKLNETNIDIFLAFSMKTFLSFKC